MPVPTNRAEIRTEIKTLSRRNFADIDTVLNSCINLAVELFSSVIWSIYDEQEWKHIITASDISNRKDNWKLPDRTKDILTAALVDVTQTDPVYYPLDIRSTVDKYDVSSYPGESQRRTFDYGATTPRLIDARIGGEMGKVLFPGKPQIVWRSGAHLFIHPIIDSSYEDWEIRLILAVKPDLLTTDGGVGSTNTIIERMPYALVSYAGALLHIMHLHDFNTGNQWLQQAASLLQGFATEQEIAKLMKIALEVKR